MSDQKSKNNSKQQQHKPKVNKATSTVNENTEPSPQSSQISLDSANSQISLESDYKESAAGAANAKHNLANRKRSNNKKRHSTQKDQHNSDERLPPRLRGDSKPVQSVFLPNFSVNEKNESETCSDNNELSSDTSAPKQIDTDLSSTDNDIISQLTMESKSMYSLFMPHTQYLTDIIEEDDDGFEHERTQTIYLALTNFQNPNDPSSEGSGNNAQSEPQNDTGNLAPSPSSSENDDENKHNRQLPTDSERSSQDHDERNIAERAKKLKKSRHARPKASSSSESIHATKQTRVRVGVSPDNPLRIDISSISMESSDNRRHRMRKDIESKLHTKLQMGNAFVYMIIPPDGGFGWVILIFSFLAQVVVDGLIFSIGILMPFIADDLMVKKSEVVLMVSIQIGPVASASINKYGFRPVALAGAVLSSVFIFIATFCPNLPTLIVFYSILGGPSLSMIWVSSQLIIGYYFEKYRPIANGMSVSGAGVGVVIGSAINSAMVPQYGWRNTLRIHGCLLCSVFLMGLTFVEVPPTKIGHVIESEGESDSDEYELTMKTMRYSKAVSRVVSTTSQLFNEKQLGEVLSEYNLTEKPGFCKKLYLKCCPCLAKKDDAQSSVDTRVGPPSYLIHPELIDRQDFYYTGPAEYNRPRTSENPFNMVTVDRNDRSVNYTLSMMHTATERPHDTHKSYMELKKTEKNPFLKFISPLNWLPKKMAHAFSLLFDFRLLSVAEFQILLASAFFFPMGFNIPFVYSTARAKIPDEYRSMISPSIGMSNFFFRILSGFLAYRYKEYTTYICGIGIIMGGCIVFISAFYGDNEIWFQFVYAVVYGIAPAFYSTLRAIIYVRALGLEKLTNAFGLTGMAMGLGVFVGTTLAGVFNELTGTHTAAFAFSGCCMILAGTLKVILPTFIKWQEKQKEKAFAKSQKKRMRK